MKFFVVFVLCIRYGPSLSRAGFPDENDSVTAYEPTASGILERQRPGNEVPQLSKSASPVPGMGTTSEALLASENNISSPINSTSTSGNASFPAEELSVNKSTHEVSTLTEIFANESQSPEPDHAASGEATTVAILDQRDNGSTPVTDDDGELEGVARGKPSSSEGENSTTTSVSETLYQKTLVLINDTYTLSILIPVAAGIVFASTIIVIIATCRCLRRRCRRRRLRRKALPDSVKNLRPSDRARLLTESSDEEF